MGSAFIGWAGLPVSALRRYEGHTSHARTPSNARTTNTKGRRQAARQQLQEWDEWDDLIWEFEQRADAAKAGDTAHLNEEREPEEIILDRRRGRTGLQNREMYQWEPIVESAIAAATMYAMWYFGRMVGGESLLIQFYSMPILFCTMRWGPRYGCYALIAVLILLLSGMGIMFGLLFTLGQGIVTLWLIFGIWNQWHHLIVLFGGVACKLLGFVLQFAYLSYVGDFNMWTMITANLTNLLDTAQRFLLPNSDMVIKAASIRLGVAVVVVFHALVVVFASHFSGTLFLDRFGVDLKRKVVVYPFIEKMKRWAVTENTERQKKLAARRKQAEKGN